MKVLVTGADGFIGSHLTESLLDKGYDVKAFTYYNSFNTWGWIDTFPKEKIKEIEIFSGDIRDMIPMVYTKRCRELIRCSTWQL